MRWSAAWPFQSISWATSSQNTSAAISGVRAGTPCRRKTSTIAQPLTPPGKGLAKRVEDTVRSAVAVAPAREDLQAEGGAPASRRCHFALFSCPPNCDGKQADVVLGRLPVQETPDRGDHARRLQLPRFLEDAPRLLDEPVHAEHHLSLAGLDDAVADEQQCITEGKLVSRGCVLVVWPRGRWGNPTVRKAGTAYPRK